MINIEVKDSGECKIVISGDEKMCAYQMTHIARHIFKENPLVSAGFLFGLANERPKEAMLKEVDRAYLSIEMGKALKSGLDDKALDKLLDKFVDEIFGGGKNE